jgi:hypothetical protein
MDRQLFYGIMYFKGGKLERIMPYYYGSCRPYYHDR